jgi:hypothetical protein
VADDRRTVRALRPAPRGTRQERITQAIARAFALLEDVVYIGLAVLLGASALVLLVHGVVTFAEALVSGELPIRVVALLDRILLILMIVELSYTVQVSFREHVLVPEPFLLVGLIATIRRVLVLTAEFSTLIDQGEPAFRSAMIELGLLTLMIVALVASLLMLRRRSSPSPAERA